MVTHRAFARPKPAIWNVAYHLWSQHDLIRQLIIRDLGQRYRGSYLGFIWPFIIPLFMLSIYTFVFSVVFKARWGEGGGSAAPSEFALMLFSGLIPFTVFSEVVSRSPTLILNAPNYVKKVVYPLQILPVVAVGSALVNSLISVGILLAAALAVLGFVSPTVALLPLAYLPLIFLCLGLGWFLASLGVYVRDIAQAVGLAVQMLLFLSPIFYPVTAVPEQLRILLYLNPLTTILSAFRHSLLGREALAWGSWTVWTVITAVIAVLGYMWFMRSKKGFADVL